MTWYMRRGPNFVAPTPNATGAPNDDIATVLFVNNAISAAIGSANITSSLATKAGTTQTDFIAGGIKTPTQQDIKIVNYLPYSVTFNSFYAQLTTGTMTAVLKINSATITGGTLFISTTALASSLMTAINTAALGSSLVMTIASTASAQGLSFTVSFTRTLATT